MPSTKPARLLVKERQRNALELRKAGATYAQIAEAVGYSSSQSAYRAVQSLLAATEVEATAEFRKVQFERLNYMITKLWPRVQAGDDKAIASVAALMAQQDRLLGTETPVEHKVVHQGAVLVIEGNEDDYVRNMELMAKQAGATDIIDAVVIEDDPIADDPEPVIMELMEGDIEAVYVEPACPRFVLPADPQRNAEGLCARCPHPKEDH